MIIKGIYKITSPTNKIYIGQSHNIKSRFSSYKYLRCKDQVKLYNSFSKYSPSNHVFEIVHILPNDVSQNILDNYEYLYINQYKELGFNLLNIREAGSRGKHSIETIEKMKGRIWKEESIQKIKYTLNGHIVSIETKEKISKKIKEHYDLGTYKNIKKRTEWISKTKGKKYPKSNRPTKEELLKLNENLPINKISPIYNVSNSTISQWMREYGIKPSMKFKARTNKK